MSVNLDFPACYRGERVFDGPETKAIVQKWIEFYKVMIYINIPNLPIHNLRSYIYYKSLVEYLPT